MNSNRFNVSFKFSSSNVRSYENELQDQTEFGEVSIEPVNTIIRTQLPSTSSTDTQSSSNILMANNGAEESSPLKETHFDPFLLPSCLRHLDGLCMIITSMVVFSVAITIALIIEIYTGAPQILPHGGIVSSDEFCSKLGFQFLKSDDSSTVDAAVLTGLCLCVTHPHAAGVGGGGFALTHDQKLVHKATTVFDFREMSSSSFSNQTLRSNLYEGKSIEQISQGVSIAVPGTIRGLERLHKKFGKKSWKDIVGQIATLAETGIVVSSELASAIQTLNVSSIGSDLKALVEKPNGVKLVEGDTLKQPDLAKTLKAIAVYGADALYLGSLTQPFINAISSRGGVLHSSDMNNYEAITSFDVNETVFSDQKVITAGPPSFGFALHSVMSVMSTYLVANATTTTDQHLEVHRLAEALKYGLAFQTELGDPSRNYSVPSFYKARQNKSLASLMMEKINDKKSQPVLDYLNGYQPLQLSSSGQQYVSLVGKDGMAVVIYMLELPLCNSTLLHKYKRFAMKTYSNPVSIGSEFGSKLMASGFVLNDAMLDFSWNGRNAVTLGLQPSKANYLSGGVRPMSSLVPSLIIPSVTKCGRYLIPGSTPGYLSLSGLAQTLLHSNRLDIPSSISQPRIHQQLYPHALSVENSTTQALREYLIEKGHQDLNVTSSLGIVDVLQWLEEAVSAFVDRRDRRNAGFSF